VNKIKKNTLTRSDIETLIRKELPNLSKSELSKSINIICNSIVEAVALDNKVEIRGFGTFSKKQIRPRKFVNPNTKKVSYLGETATIHFKPSKKLSNYK
jgi:integration host factor subunit beta